MTVCAAPQLCTDLGSRVDDLGFLIRESADAYHVQARKYLSSHALADFRRCPLLYFRRQQGLVADEDRPAYVVGRAAHTLILEGRTRFDAEYAVGGPVNPKTGAVFGQNTKAWTLWAEEQGKPVLTDAQVTLVERMNESVRSHLLARELLAHGVAEAVVRTQYRGIACQIRMDWFDPHGGLVDLKTCDDLHFFEADARRYGYLHQTAFYRAVLAQVIGLKVPVHFLAVEKKEPFRCGVWQVTADALALAERENEAAIERLKACSITASWPTGYETVRTFHSL